MLKKLLLLGVLMSMMASVTIARAEDVYATANGKRYHKTECRLIKNKNAVKIEKDAAINKGLAPCKVCFKDEIAKSESTADADKK